MNSRFSPWIIAGVLCLSGLALTGQLYSQAQHQNDHKLQAAFQSASDIATNNLSSRLDRYAMILRGLKGYYEGSEHISVTEFHHYAESLQLQSQSGLLGLGLIQWISDSPKDAQVLDALPQGADHDPLQRQGRRDFYAPITLIESSINSHLTTPGFDTWTHPTTRAAMERARDSNDVAVTAQLDFIQRSNPPQEHAIAMFLPIYRQSAPLNALEDRRAALLGWVYAPFDLQRVMAALQPGLAPDIALEIYESEPWSDETRIFQSDQLSKQAGLPGMLQTQRQIEVGGRQWTVFVNSTPEFISRVVTDDRPILLLIIGLLLTLTLSGAAWLLLKRRQSSEFRYQRLFDNTQEGLLICAPDLSIIDANPTATALSGYPIAQLLQLKLSELMLIEPERLRSSVKDMMANAFVQEEWWQRCQNGNRFLSEINGYKLDANHLCILFRDLTDRKKHEKRIERLSRLYKTLSETNQAIVRMSNEQELFPKICQFVVEFGGLKMAWIGQLDEPSLFIKPVVAYGTGTEYLEGLQIIMQDDRLEGRGPTGTAFRENRPVIVNDYSNDLLTLPWRERALKFGWGAAVALPIERTGQPYAVLNVYSEELNAFDDEIVELLLEMVKDISYALGNFDREKHRQHLAEQVSKAYARLNHIIDINPAIIYALKPNPHEAGDYIIDFISATVQALTGFSPTDWQAPGFWFSHVHPDDQNEAAKAGQYLLKQGFLKHQYRFRCADGQYLWIEDHLKVNSKAAGEPIEIVGAWLDITDRKRAEQALIENEIRMATVLDNVGACIFIKDTQGRYQYANRPVLALWNKTFDEVIGRGDDQFFDSQSTAQILENDRKVLIDGETIYREETNLVTHTGKTATYWTCKLPMRHQNGEIYALCGISSDITELKRLEQAFQEKEQLLSDSQRIAHIGSWHVNLTTGKLTWSEEAYRIYQQPLGTEYTFDTFLDLLHPDDRLAMRTWSEQCLANQSPAELHFRTLLPDGTIRFLEGRGGLIQDPLTQAPIAMAGTVQDISGQKRMEDKLQRWMDAFHYCAHGIAIGDHKTNQIAACNPAFAHLLGYNSPDEVQGLAILSIYAPNDRENIKRWIQEANQTGYIQYEAQMLRQDGSAVDVQMDLVSVKDATDQVQYRVATIQDISQRKRDQATLQLQSSALEAAASAIMITDQTGAIQWINPAFTLLTGYSAEEAIGKMPGDLVNSGKQSRDLYEALWRTIISGKVWHGEIVNKRKDGTLYTEEQIITPVIDDHNVIRHYIAVKQDITDRKHAEAELDRYRHHLEQLVDDRTRALEKARQEAERLSQVKTMFLANMSHEIRTPMNAVLGFCYLLEKRVLDDKSRQLVKKIHGAGQSLLAIINDILDFSKIEAGRLDIELSPFRLDELIDHVAELMSSSTQDKEVELVISPATSVDALIGDGLRIRQVLVNLVSNAIKFTERGEVELRIDVIGESEDDVQVRFSVLDTGIGISEQQQHDIFSAFAQADTSISRRFGGTGLGLAICQQLVRLMGGELNVSSVLGQGSQFWFELSLIRDTKAPLPTQPHHLNVLLADDNATTRVALSQVLAALGWTADIVESGEKAFHHFVSRWDSARPYDLVMLDWTMPGQSGLATAQAIRQVIESASSDNIATIILLMTAYGPDEWTNQSGMDSVNGVISKPVTPSNLFDAVTSALKQRDAPQLLPPHPVTTPRRIANVRILVVDDSEINREVAKQILEADGAKVVMAANGQEAVDWLNLHPDGIDMVLMDVQMPVMDGYAATRLLRQQPRWAQLPIIALTAGAFDSLRDEAYAFAEDQANCFAAGMNDFVSKPFNVEELMAIIQRHTGCSSESMGENTIESSISPPTPSTLPGIDIPLGLKVWNDEAIYRTYLRKFVEAYAQAGHEIQNLMQANDAVTASTLAHKLAGVAGNLALTAVLTKARELDSLIANGQPSEEAIKALQHAIDEACVAINQWQDRNNFNLGNANIIHAYQDPAEIVMLLERLLDALDQDNPFSAEPLLIKLQGKLPASEVERISTLVLDYDFPAAKRAVTELLHNLQLN